MKILSNLLTEREIRLLQMVADGLSNAEIGAQMFLSEQTVKKKSQPNNAETACYQPGAGSGICIEGRPCQVA